MHGLYSENNLQYPRLYIGIEGRNEICIKGNSKGFRWLARRCLSLVNDPSQGHIHLDHEGDVVESVLCSCTFVLVGASDKENKQVHWQHSSGWLILSFIAVLIIIMFIAVAILVG